MCAVQSASSSPSLPLPGPTLGWTPHLATHLYVRPPRNFFSVGISESIGSFQYGSCIFLSVLLIGYNLRTRVTSFLSCCLFRPPIAKRAAAASIIFERRTCATGTNRPFWASHEPGISFPLLPLTDHEVWTRTLYLECRVAQSVELLFRLTMEKNFRRLQGDPSCLLKTSP